MRVLVTGATGHVGSELIPALGEAGHQVYAGVRDLSDPADFSWGRQVLVRQFDIEDAELIDAACVDIDVVYYLVHSMADDDFMRKDREAAEWVAQACERHGVGRIVYLSGLIPDGELSDHLQSRLEVEQIFIDSAVTTTVLRAAMVIGAGSVSFEILRRLTNRLPVTPVPTWMRSDLQPIAIEDVITLLVAAAEGPTESRVFDVGGDEVVSYPELLERFAQVRGVRRWRPVLPLLPMRVVGWVIALITRMDRPTVVTLIESLSHDLTVRDQSARDELGDGRPYVSLTDALTRAMSA